MYIARLTSHAGASEHDMATVGGGMGQDEGGGGKAIVRFPPSNPQS